MRLRRVLALAATVALFIVSTACGDDDVPPPSADAGPVAGAGECDWPMWGHNLSRTFAYPCETALGVDTVADLQQAWFFNTNDVVTATPAIVDDTAYVGDWSGRFYAIDTTTGEPRWTFDAATDPNVYSGQIVGSAAVAEVDGERLVIFPSARTVYALDAADGTQRWSLPFGTDDTNDFTEIQSSPAVFDGKVFVGTDTHNRPQPAGMHAIDVATGELLWTFDAEQGSHNGCGDVWSSPSIDTERRMLYFGTANCPSSPDGWGQYTEAIIAVDVDTGEPRWSYQPHEPNNDDLDFAGAPNLFTIDGVDMVGLGNKDGTYYALERERGELAWEAKATEPGLEEEGSSFSTGGFIGPTAYSDGVIAGGTAVGPPPYLHAFSAANGKFFWQTAAAQETYAGSVIANGVLFAGGNDFTLRALDLRSGEILWSQEMKGVVAGAPAIVGDDLYAVAGIREPGLETRSENSGVYKFSIPSPGDTSTTESSTTTTGPPVGNIVLEPSDQTCFVVACEMFQTGITLREPPAGLSPSAQLLITADPFSATLQGRELGEPQQWLVPGTPAATEGATVFALFISESDDNPIGGLLCVLDEQYACRSETLPRLAPSYNRITLLALKDADTAPTLADGAARLLVTVSFDPPLRPISGG